MIETGRGNRALDLSQSFATIKIDNHDSHFLDLNRTCFIHVGKTSGSLLSCLFGGIHRRACISDEAWEKMTDARQTSVLSRSIQRGGYVHMGGDNCEEGIDSFLVSLRNPIDRFESFFYYEKIRQYPIGGQPYPKGHKDFQKRLRRAPLFVDCYDHLGTLAVEGLGTELTDSIPIEVKNMTCPQRAWATAMGARRLGEHSWYNYEYYNEVMGRYVGNWPRILVMRNEHLSEDWDSIHEMWQLANGTASNTNRAATTFGEQLFDVKVRTSAESRAGVEPLSKEALQNLCRALCWEIQHYKRILLLAENINETQMAGAIEELQVYCPNEPSHIRKCPLLPTFPRRANAMFKGTGKIHSNIWE